MIRFAILFALLTTPALANEIEARVVSVYDGDTLTVEADIWPGITARSSVRIDGIDTPEIRGKCEKEKRMARQARELLATTVGDAVVLRDVRKGKYAGRVIARVYTSDGRDVAAIMLRSNLAREYHGSKREGWCDE